MRLPHASCTHHTPFVMAPSSYIRYLTLNTRDMDPARNLYGVYSYIMGQQAQIAFLQETYTTGDQDRLRICWGLGVCSLQSCLATDRMEFLTVLLFGLCVFGGSLAGPACNPAPASENLALKGTASQSTQYGYLGLPSYPLSGKRTGSYHDMSCSATNGDLNPWWKVDLGKSQAIGSVVVVNRADCCPERIRGAEVRVGDNENNNNPVCGTITDLSAGSVSTLCCKGMVGRYVSVVITGRQEYLTLCGVEVYGVVAQKQEPQKEESHVCW
ncbi:hypothetical protein NDU88_004182 [Pleurodeles waltl]|uniref:Fucolectin tachylectin-4 pentraxin-1 domain-containing protein n=1 Tax=Pleurodeles waltl TaxID=8319 RepID=A0AAV7V4J5_PLEWA|nr:hypothetical protein NDU88_004182 [Pleurodeles waltl]